MGFDQRPPTSGGISPISSPNLPIADSSQGHDIPTGVGPSLAKLQDWSAWLAANSVLYFDPVGAPGLIANDITIGGDLTVTGTADIAGAVSMGSSAAVGTDLTVGDDLAVTGDTTLSGLVTLSGTQPASTADPGPNSLYSTNVCKAWAYIETDGAGNVSVNDGFNVDHVAITGSSVRVTFARGFPGTNYCVVSTTANSASFGVVNSVNGAYVDIGVYSVVAAALRDPATFTLRIYVAVMGRN